MSNSMLDTGFLNSERMGFVIWQSYPGDKSMFKVMVHGRKCWEISTFREERTCSNQKRSKIHRKEKRGQRIQSNQSMSRVVGSFQINRQCIMQHQYILHYTAEQLVVRKEHMFLGTDIQKTISNLCQGKFQQRIGER